ncbi:U6 snRNA-associated Sm-like protein LSm2 domain-containing protein [Rozella allomycis CSF55]|uniref:U6 snRNA-associated Sm-like protein LSm2 domain-containing protein n=1 Tax=Rozella allomycis (strain CSF55) TaxID=988480 RepID=A0A075AXH3_ROZAC|nr:U6 snRNA-associated Sm-like protein LSm2 domain-containing protein [Rozella allomycis CSF55]|eukprot:EPZ33239.1 U6 snRNA-associated Sm-like protein LSm2 domain-containing protein [Rozella allomycis CSF55]
MNSLEEEALKRLSRIKGNANTSENFNTSETVQDVAEEILKEAEIKGKQLLNEVDLTQLAPKKVTWDLERDIQSRMKILEKETMNFIWAQLLIANFSIEENSKSYGKKITIELKNDIAIKGVLNSVDQFLNLKLDDIEVLEKEKYPHLWSVRNIFIRGSVVRYVALPVEAVDTELLQDATRREAENYS